MDSIVASINCSRLTALEAVRRERALIRLALVVATDASTGRCFN
jgi:hypothetical protein